MTFLKKIIPGALAVALGLLVGASSAHAAVLSVTPATVSVKAGDTVTVQVMIDPQGTVYTVKAIMSFSADVLQETGYVPAAGWFPLTQKGYDSVDNTGGSITKTEGYPGGLKQVGSFGTITFTAVKAGTANIGFSPSSIAYNSSNQNALTGAQGTAVVTVAGGSSTAPSAGATSTPSAASTTPVSGTPSSGTGTAGTAPVPKKAPKASSGASSFKASPLARTAVTATTTGTSDENASNTAAMIGGATGSASPTSGSRVTEIIILIIVLIIIIGGIIWYRREQKK